MTFPGSEARSETPAVDDRARIIASARAVRDEIARAFAVQAYWNQHKPADAAPLDWDRDGSMRRLLDGLDAMLAEDIGAGPIPPIGGWCNPIFARAPEKPQ